MTIIYDGNKVQQSKRNCAMFSIIATLIQTFGLVTCILTMMVMMMKLPILPCAEKLES